MGFTTRQFTGGDEEEPEFFFDFLGCDDFWWDEEDRHRLF